MSESKIPTRTKRLGAWTVLMRQSELIANMAETIRYEDKNPDAARILRDKANELREVADWLREAE